jgi:hypothetical protein
MATQATTPANTKFTAKVTGRTVTPLQGKLLYTLTTPEGKEVNVSFTKEQIQMYKELDITMPKPGAEVTCEFNVNPGTGLVSDQWVALVL